MIGALTSFRFFAALSVALYHLPFVLPSTFSGETFKYGYLGVNFFFILSGFIIHFTYGRTDLNIKSFMIKRAARLLPVYYLTFIIWVVLFFDSWGNSLSDKLNSGVSAITLTQSYYNGMLFNLGYNPVSWSISVEVFFYLAYPYLRRNNIYIYLLLFWSGLAMFAQHPAMLNFKEVWPNFFYFNPIGRIFEFCVGILLCDLHVKYKKRAVNSASLLQGVSLLILALSLILVPKVNDTQLINLYLAFPLGFFLFAFSFSGKFSQVFEFRFLQFLGEASFCFYLLHHMTFRLLDSHLSLIPIPVSLRIIVAMVVAALFAIILHVSFELPVRRRIIKKFAS